MLLAKSSERFLPSQQRRKKLTRTRKKSNGFVFVNSTLFFFASIQRNSRNREKKHTELKLQKVNSTFSLAPSNIRLWSRKKSVRDELKFKLQNSNGLSLKIEKKSHEAMTRFYCFQIWHFDFFPVHSNVVHQPLCISHIDIGEVDHNSQWSHRSKCGTQTIQKPKKKRLNLCNSSNISQSDRSKLTNALF